MHVLLCEDDDLIATGIIAGLSAQGLTVDRVANASAARAMLQAAHFDVMVLDLGLPDEDGLKLLQRLRQQGESLPVLILTARDAVTDRVDGCRPGPTTTCSNPSTCASWLRVCTPWCDAWPGAAST